MFFKKKPYKNLNQITINKDALLKNYQYFQDNYSKALVAPVLKSNAYGHGIELIGKFIDREIKPPFICVDSLHEAYQLEKTHIKTPILIIGYTFPENFKVKKKIKFSVPVFDIETLKILNHHQPGVKVHIKIDSGMNRLGLKLKDIPSFIRTAKEMENIEFEGIYSHFSQADNLKAKDFTLDQIAIFKEAISMFEHHGFSFTYRHIAATAGAKMVNSKDFNLVRIGIGFYGYPPFNKSTSIGKKMIKGTRPALSLKTHLIQIKHIKKGDQVSYDGTFIAPKDMSIGILPIGYNDGVDRRLSNRGVVIIEGFECSIIGRVCMNVTIVDISMIRHPKQGVEAIIYSNDKRDKNSLTKSSKLANTIPYVLLCNLTESTKRTLI